MDFQSAMETFAEAWVAANVGKLPPTPTIQFPITTTTNSTNSINTITNTTSQISNFQSPITDGDSSSTNHKSSNSCSRSRSSTNLLGTKEDSTKLTQPLSPTGMDLSTNSSSLIRHRLQSSSIPGGKAIPIHCLVRRTSISTISNQSGRSRSPLIDLPPDIDDFLIIPSAVPFNELLPTALGLLGQPKDSISEGWISIRNWKPLRLDQICDQPSKTVGDILQDLTNHATLTIVITTRTRSSCVGEVGEDLKEKLLRLLLAQSGSVVAAVAASGGTGTPITSSSLAQVTMSGNGGGGSGSGTTDELRRRFDIWYSAQHTHTLNSLLNSLSQQQQSPGHQTTALIPSGGQGSLTSNQNHSQEPPIPSHHHHHPNAISISGKDGGESSHHHVYHGISPHQKTRMRTSFDPEMELPRLQDWFAENPHPSRHQIQQYVRELNSLECRKDRKALDINNVIYWFKNARAAQKRNELRYNGLSPHPPFHNSILSNRHVGINGDPNNNNSSPPTSRLPHLQFEPRNETSSPNSSHSSQQKELNQPIRIKEEEEDSISVDVEAHEGEVLEPRDLSLESRKSPPQLEERLSLGDDECSSSVSTRSSPLYSPRPQFDFPNHPSHHHPLLGGGRFPGIMDHHSFMAYSHHLNAFTFENHHATTGGIDPTTHHHHTKRSHHPFDFHPHAYAAAVAAAGGFPGMGSTGSHSSEELISSLLAKRQQTEDGIGTGSMDERRKRNRTFIDPVSEVPRLEAWFSLNTHPSHALILKYTEELNRMPYRQKFPKLEPKNVQFWFKNRRAKSKRLKMTI